MSCRETPPYNFQPTNSCIVFRAASLCCFPDRARDDCSFLSILVMMNALPNQDFIHGFREGTISISSGTVSCVLRGCSIHFWTVLDSFLHLPLQKNITHARPCPCFEDCVIWELKYTVSWKRPTRMFMGWGALHKLFVGNSARHFV